VSNLLRYCHPDKAGTALFPITGSAAEDRGAQSFLTFNAGGYGLKRGAFYNALMRAGQGESARKNPLPFSCRLGLRFCPRGWEKPIIACTGCIK
jgi:hypothetical protein